MEPRANTPRKLKRQASQPSPIKLLDHPCVVGGRIKDPELIPVVRSNDVPFVQIKTSSKWLHAVLTGYQSSKKARALVSKALSDIKGCLRIARDNEGCDDGEVANAMKAHLAEAGMESDDDQSGYDDDDSISEVEEKKVEEKKGAKNKPKKKTEQKTEMRFVVVEVHGISLIVCDVNNKVNLSYSQDNVESFYKLCQVYNPEDVMKHRDEKAKKRRQQLEEVS